MAIRILFGWTRAARRGAINRSESGFLAAGRTGQCKWNRVKIDARQSQLDNATYRHVIRRRLSGEYGGFWLVQPLRPDRAGPHISPTLSQFDRIRRALAHSIRLMHLRSPRSQTFQDWTPMTSADERLNARHASTVWTPHSVSST